MKRTSGSLRGGGAARLLLALAFTPAACRTAAPSAPAPRPPVAAPAEPAARQRPGSEAMFHAMQAYIALQRGDGAAAEAALADAMSFDPDSALLMAWRARAALLRGEPGSALTWADRALERDDACEEALAARVDALWSMDRPADARPALARLVALRPGDAGHARRLMEVHVAAEQFKDAGAVQRALDQARPGDADMHRVLLEVCSARAAWGCALDAAEEASRRSPADVPTCRLRAAAQQATGLDAAAAFERCVPLAPESPEVLADAWRARFRVAGPGPVVTLAQQLAKARPAAADLLQDLGERMLDAHVPAATLVLADALAVTAPIRGGSLRARALSFTGRCAEAIAALAAVPPGSDADADAVRVSCPLRMGRVADALAAWDATAPRRDLQAPRLLDAACRALATGHRAADALALGTPLPDDGPATSLSRARCRILAGASRAAVEDARGALAGRPEDPAALWHLGLVLSEVGDHVESIRAFRALHALDPDAPEVRNVLAYALVQQPSVSAADAAEAVRLAARAVAAQPASPEMLDTLGVAQLRSGDVASAHASLARAARWLPHDPEVRLHEGEALAARGDLPAARAAWKAGLDVLPADPALAARLRAHLEARP